MKSKYKVGNYFSVKKSVKNHKGWWGYNSIRSYWHNTRGKQFNIEKNRIYKLVSIEDVYVLTDIKDGTTFCMNHNEIKNLRLGTGTKLSKLLYE